MLGPTICVVTIVSVVLVFLLKTSVYGVLSVNSKRILTNTCKNVDDAETITKDTKLSTKPINSHKFNFQTDTFVHVHIQKTGGTAFGLNLVKNLVDQQCDYRNKTWTNSQMKLFVSKYNCARNFSRNIQAPFYDSWLFSRYSAKWFCGLHASVTMLDRCLAGMLFQLTPSIMVSEIVSKPSKKPETHWITNLRDPVSRFLSEFNHVSKRGGVWQGKKYAESNHKPSLSCRGKDYESSLLDKCYKGRRNWMGVSLEDFMGCEWNLGVNRMTVMLGDLEEVGCYDGVLPVKSGLNSSYNHIDSDVKLENYKYTKYHKNMEILLESAKLNLKEKFAYFSINEEPEMSQELFEKMFGLKFRRKLYVRETEKDSVSEKLIRSIKTLNKYDVELYDFGKKLFLERFFKINESVACLGRGFTHFNDFISRFTQIFHRMKLSSSSIVLHRFTSIFHR